MSGEEQISVAGTKGWLERMSARLKPIGDLRDSLLVVASILYACGYAVWSLNAMQNKLGLLPALDLQYFIAGSVPVLIILVAYLAAKFLRRLSDKWPKVVGPDAKGWRWWLRTALLILYAFAFNGAWILGFLSLFFPGLRDWLLGIIGPLLVATTIFAPPTNDRFLSWLSRFYRNFLVYYLMVGFLLLGIVWYLEKVYPNLPQEFGGVLPRCAYLDIEKNQISSETLAALSPAGVTSTGSVIRSAQVDILYMNGDRLLIRAEGRVLDINRGVIRIVSSCD